MCQSIAEKPTILVKKRLFSGLLSLKWFNTYRHISFVYNFASKQRHNNGYTHSIFLKTTLNHLKHQQGLPVRYQQQAIDVALAAKLTLMYGKYYLAMLHTELFMSEENSSF